MARQKVLRVTKLSKSEIDDRAASDREMVMVALAKAEHSMGDKTAEAIARRCKMNTDDKRIYQAFVGLREHGLAVSYINPRRDLIHQWQLTDKGWQELGQKPPIWAEGRG